MINKSNDVRIYWCKEWEEFQVILPSDSSEGTLTYHTDDILDAQDTCSVIAIKANLLADHEIRSF